MAEPVPAPPRLTLAASPDLAAEPAQRAPRSLREATTELRGRKELALTGGNPAGTHRQQALGKLTARERIDLLLDEDSFVELDGLRPTPCQRVRAGTQPP